MQAAGHTPAGSCAISPRTAVLHRSVNIGIGETAAQFQLRDDPLQEHVTLLVWQQAGCDHDAFELAV